MIKNKSKNLFDGNNFEFGNIDATTGDFTIRNTRVRYNDFLTINPSTEYTISGNFGGSVVIFFDNNYNHISFLATNSLPHTFTTPSNAYFIKWRESLDTATLLNLDIQLELGSTATAYVPYNDIQVSVGQFEQGQGKNLFDGELEEGSINGANGTLVSSSISVRTKTQTKVNNNTQYTVKAFDNNVIQYAIAEYDNNNIFLKHTQISGSSATVTTDTNTFYILIRFTFNDANNRNLNFNIQLELGNTATTYEPYKYLAIHNPASNDIPIPALNNKTLNEVFVGGQLVAGDYSDGLIIGGSVKTIFIDSTNFLVVSPSTVVYFYRETDISTTDLRLQIREQTTNTQQTIGINNNSTVFTLNFTQINRIRFFNNTLDDYFISNLHAINLTSLGIASQTKAQMDAYFEAWQRNNAGTLLANTFIQHDQNSVPIADLNGKTLDEVFDRSILTDITALPNGVKYYEVSGGNIVQRVEEYVLQSSDVNILTTSETNVDYVRLNKPLDYIAYASVNENLVGSSVVNEWTEVNTVSRNQTSNIGKYNIRLRGIEFEFYFTKGTYANLAAAKTALTGTQLLYQLATPITIVSGVSITQAQLDFWYSVWQQNHKLGMRVHRASGNDIPLAVLNNQSLNQVFVGGNALINHDFSDGDNNWSTLAVTEFVVNNSIASFKALSLNGRLFQQINYTINEKVYIVSRFKSTSNLVALGAISSDTILVFHSGSNQFETLTGLFTVPVSLERNSARIIDRRTSGFDTVFVDYIYHINLTDLGIASLTQSQLDYLFTVWQYNNQNALISRQFIQEALT
jgi:hypothetical protein